MKAGSLSVALACASLALAADFWATKPAADWNEKEARRIMSRSPWAKEVSMQMGGGGGGMAGGGGRSGGRRGGGGGAAMGGGGMSAESSGMGGGGGGMGAGGGMGGGAGMEGGAPPAPMTTIVWDSAPPVHEARVKLEQRDYAELRAKDYYVVSMVGFPMRGQQGDAQQMRKRLAAGAAIERKGKDAIAASDVGFVRAGEKITVVFLFPRTAAIEPADKDVTFHFKTGPMEVKAKFALKDMVYGGKLAL